MLLQFSVENFLSIREEVTLDFTATADKSLPENIVKFGNKRFLRAIGVFGANASGKTTLCRALLAAVMMIRRSNVRQVSEPLWLIPFKFNKQTVKAPSIFKFLFVQDGIKYYYSFEATNNVIKSEILYKYESQKPRLIFERTNVNQYKFPKKAEHLLNEIKGKNTENKFFLATATSWNDESTRAAYMWFTQGINVICDGKTETIFNPQRYLDDSDNKLLDFTINLLHEADISIDGLQIEPLQKGMLNIKTQHIIPENELKQTTYELNLEDESKGTQVLFNMAALLEETLKTGGILCIDEIDTHLHPELVQYLIRLFYNSKVNNNGAQLLFTTHNVALMSLNLVRRDQLYFTQKDKQTSATDLYSLAQFSVRKGENIRKAYLLGRFGAIPDVGYGEL